MVAGFGVATAVTEQVGAECISTVALVHVLDAHIHVQPPLQAALVDTVAQVEPVLPDVVTNIRAVQIVGVHAHAFPVASLVATQVA